MRRTSADIQPSKNPDGLSRRRMMAAAAVIAAGASSEASAQAQPAPGAGKAWSHLRFHNPPGKPSAPGFTQGVEAIGPGRIIYVSGQQGLDPDNKVVGDFEAQVAAAFDIIKAVLADAGASFDHVVKLNHYFIDLKAHQRLLGPIRARYFVGRPQPASTTVQVGGLVRPGALYEVEAVAIVPA
jgi:enamine deaminase RidA (YjgF/YER057c/UK114 family)